MFECKRLYPVLIGIGLFVASSLSLSQEQLPVRVLGYGQHIGTNVVYLYRVINNSDKEIGLVAVGYQFDWNDSTKEPIEKRYLNVLPAGWNDETRTPPGKSTSPAGWVADVETQEENPHHIFEWDAPAEVPGVAPGQTLEGFSVTLPKPDLAHLKSYFTVYFGNGKTYTAPMELADTTPPTLSVSLTPATLWPPNGKPVPITATVTVNDDYDPNPEIKLESITANEPLLAGDIADAQYGTDDRRFTLSAKRSDQSTPGRVYTVTYSATDASGNKATASTTVTVPHDQRK